MGKIWEDGLFVKKQKQYDELRPLLPHHISIMMFSAMVIVQGALEMA